MARDSVLKTFLWFPSGLEEALEFYKDTFQNVQIHSLNRTSPDGPLFTAEFSIYGHELIGMNSESKFAFNESISLSIQCDGQEEVDRLWDAITKEGTAGKCGWCKDKYGLSWQVTPFQMLDHLGNPDPKKAEFAWTALLGMTKIVIANLYE